MNPHRFRSTLSACGLAAALLFAATPATAATASTAKEHRKCLNDCGATAAPKYKACRLSHDAEFRSCAKLPAGKERNSCKAAANKTMTACSATVRDEVKQCQTTCNAKT
jgi:hypothetical protein